MAAISVFIVFPEWKMSLEVSRRGGRNSIPRASGGARYRARSFPVHKGLAKLALRFGVQERASRVSWLSRRESDPFPAVLQQDPNIMPKQKTTPRMPQRSATVVGKQQTVAGTGKKQAAADESAPPPAPSDNDLVKRAKVKKKK